MLINASDGFLNFSDQHSLGYPIFLSLIRVFSDEPVLIIYTQLWVFALALLFLSLSIRKISSNNWLALIAILPICANPYVAVYHFSVQPNSLFISVSIMMIACLISSFSIAHFGALFFFGLFMGLGISIMPIGWVYLCLLIFVPFIIAQQRHCSYLRAFFVPFITLCLFLIVENSAYLSLHDKVKENDVASRLFAKAVVMESSQPSPYATKDPRTAIWKVIEEDFLETKTKIWTSGEFTSKQNLLVETEKNVRTSFAQKEFEFAQTVLERPLSDIQMDIATSRIIQDPLAFINVCVVHYQGLWESDAMITYAFWFVSILTVLISIWFMIKGQHFNGAFATAFSAALIMQASTLWVAITGLGPDHIIASLSPMLSLSLSSLIIGIYVTFINPVHPYD